MKQFYKSQEFKLNPYKDLYNLLYGKSKYFQNLVQKKNESYNLLSQQKIEIIKEKLLRSNRFERDYSIFAKEKLILKPNTIKSTKFYFSPDIKPVFLSPEEESYPNKYKKKEYDIDGFSLIYKETNSSNFSKPKPLKILNTSSYTKLNEKGKYKKNKGENHFIDLEDRKNFEFPNSRYNNSNMLNNSNLTNYTSSFLTSIGNNVIINRNKKSN